MLLRRLSEYADRLELPPAMYDRTPVRWFVDLDADGRLLGFVPLQGGGKRADRRKDLWVPQLVRSSGIRPKLLADNGEYVLGVARDPGKAGRVAQAHRQFKELVRRCWEETGEPAVGAVVRFLEAWDPDAAARHLPEDFKPDDVLTFRVGDVLPVDLPAVRRFWADYTSGDGESPVMTCLVCGETRPVEKRLPVKIKGVPGGQTSGTALISANSPAFESYGLEASLVAPTCRDCGERFGKAANALIDREDTRLYVGPLVYLFWTREDVGFSPVTLLGNPAVDRVDAVLTLLDDLSNQVRARLAARVQEQDVKAALRAAASGQPAPLEVVEPAAFYATALSGSGGRVVVRDWMETTVERAIANLRRWFEIQRLVDEATGQEGRPYGVFTLAVSLYRDGKEVEPQVPRLLMRGALHGGPLPNGLLFKAVRRNRAEQGVTRPRVALIKMVLASQGGVTMSQELVALNPEHRDAAYHCGRLLAQLEAIQRLAVRGAKATLIDRYFGAASTAPATVFGVLVRSAQAHLARIRKDRRDAYEALQQRLEEILARVDRFPTTLDLQRQALFALGYYHQRAANRAAARAGREQGEAIDGGTEEDA